MIGCIHAESDKFSGFQKKNMSSLNFLGNYYNVINRNPIKFFPVSTNNNYLCYSLDGWIKIECQKLYDGDNWVIKQNRFLVINNQFYWHSRK